MMYVDEKGRNKTDDPYGLMLWLYMQKIQNLQKNHENKNTFSKDAEYTILP